MSNKLQTTIQAEAITAAIFAATGQRPSIIYKGETAKILFTKNQAKSISDFIESQMKKEGKIKIEAMPILAPIAIKKLGPIVMISAAALFLIGYFFGKR